MDYGPSLLKVLTNCTVDSLTHNAMQKSAEAEVGTEVFATAAAVKQELNELNPVWQCFCEQ